MSHKVEERNLLIAITNVCNRYTLYPAASNCTNEYQLKKLKCLERTLNINYYIWIRTLT